MSEILSTNLKIAREYFGYSVEQITDYLHDSEYPKCETDEVNNYSTVYILEKLGDLYGINSYNFFNDNFNPETLTIVPGVNYSNMSTEDLEEIARFHSIVLAYNNLLNLS